MGPGPLVEKHCYKTYPMEIYTAVYLSALTFTRAAAALKPILATDSRFRLRGGRLKPERELVKEHREAAQGVMGV